MATFFSSNYKENIFWVFSIYIKMNVCVCVCPYYHGYQGCQGYQDFIIIIIIYMCLLSVLGKWKKNDRAL